MQKKNALVRDLETQLAVIVERVAPEGPSEGLDLLWRFLGLANSILERSRVSTARIALQDIADAQGDVDAYIAQYDEAAQKAPKIAADIAQRLIAAGRAQDALGTIEAVEHQTHGWNWPDFDWEDARIAALEGLGRGDDAQAVLGLF